MQLDISHFTKPSIKVEDVTDKVAQDAVGQLPAVLNDEARVREGDLLPPPRDNNTQNLRQPAALRGVDLSKITSKAELMCVLTYNLPRNDYNMPRIIYRPDLLDPAVFHMEASTAMDEEQLERANAKFRLMQELLDASTIILQYYEGFPSIPGQGPIWEQLEWESVEEFEAFKAYLQQPGARQLALLTEAQRVAGQQLFHTNFWAFRCLSHDTFAVVHYQRQREQRILSSDDAHFLESERMLAQLKNCMAEINWDVLKDDPKTFVEVYERLTKIQRGALGTVDRRSDGGQGVTSVDLIMKRATEHHVISESTEDSGGVDIAKLLQDPKSVEAAQSLILRVTMKP